MKEDNTTTAGDQIGRFLRWTDDPAFDVWLGLFVSLMGIVMFGIHGHWMYLTLLPFGTVSIASGVAEQASNTNTRD